MCKFIILYYIIVYIQKRHSDLSSCVSLGCRHNIGLGFLGEMCFGWVEIFRVIHGLLHLLTFSHIEHISIAIVACRPVARQRPRNKQLYNNLAK
jgi:hypothetical protein